MKFAQRLGITLGALAFLLVLVIVLLLFVYPRISHADVTCADSWSPFYVLSFGNPSIENYEEAEYINGFLTVRFKKAVFGINHNQGISFQYKIFDDACFGFYEQPYNPFGFGAIGKQLPLDSVSTFSVRFTSPTRFEWWNDDTNTPLDCENCVGHIDTCDSSCGGETRGTPGYASVSFFLFGNFTTSNELATRSYAIQEPQQPPPILTSHLAAPAACPSFSADTSNTGPFVEEYNVPEYKNGLLRYHFRFSNGFRSNSSEKNFYIIFSVFDENCHYVGDIPSLTSSGFPVLEDTYSRYFSVRFTSPTHFEFWNDDLDMKGEGVGCEGCEGDLDLSAFSQIAHPRIQIKGFATSRDYVRVDFSAIPFPTVMTSVCPEHCNSNMLFLPGIESSRLYDTENGERQLWEPPLHGDAAAAQLAMTSDGVSVRDDIHTHIGDAIDTAYVPGKGNVYKSFISDMNELVANDSINAWESGPYDWRLSLEDILTHGSQTGADISYLTATDTPYILQELKHLAATSRTGKVTIIAHSNGGLVAKALMQTLGPTTTAQLIDKVILVASPQVGTPQAIAAFLHGDNQGLPFDKFPVALSLSASRSISLNMPGAYTLLPSNGYFTQVDNPVVSFDRSTLPDWTSKYGDVVHSVDRLQNFMNDSARAKPAYNDLKTPEITNPQLFAEAQAAHQMIDDWTPPADVQLIQIAGWGIPTTLSGITYASSSKSAFCSLSTPCEHGLNVSASTTVDGDGTVVVPSALWVSTSTEAVNYWLDLKRYSNDHWIVSFGGVNEVPPFKHANILEVDALRNFLVDTLTSSTKPIQSYIYLLSQTPASTGSRLRYTLHSPLTLDLFDTAGHHTGISTTTGEIEEAVPGTYYMEFGDTKYLFTDGSADSHVVMRGYATSTFTFNVDEFQGDAVVASTTFKDIPVTPTTNVAINAASGITTLSPMHIDTGTASYNIAPKQNDVAVLDTVPPEIKISFSTTTNALVFNGQDDAGVPTVTSTTTYPVLKKNQKKYDGIATTTITARDTAGNTTVLIYTEQLPSPAQRDTIKLFSISYNGATTMLANTSASYKWRTAPNQTYKLLASFLKTATTDMESHYRPKKNITVLMTKPIELDDNDSDDDVDLRPVKMKPIGIVLPYIMTDKGKVTINY